MNLLLNACTFWAKSSVFMIFNSYLNNLVLFSFLKVINIVFQSMIRVLHSDIIPGNLASNIWRNNAYKISYLRKKRKANITERRRNGDWIALNGHWMVTEMYLPFSRMNGGYMDGTFQFSRNSGFSSCVNWH